AERPRPLHSSPRASGCRSTRYVPSRPKGERPMMTAKTMRSATRKPSEQRIRMVHRSTALLKQVSNATRLRLVLVLSEGARPGGALCEELSQGQPVVSQHLSILRHSGIV